jgi:hypothetical protein
MELLSEGYPHLAWIWRLVIKLVSDRNSSLL